MLIRRNTVAIQKAEADMSTWHVLSAVAVLLAAMPTEILALEEAATETSNQFLAGPKPLYPKRELLRNREGWVLVELTIGDEGSVKDAKIRDSSGSDAFDRATLKAVRKWHYPRSTNEDLTVMVNFVFDRVYAYFKRDFLHRYVKAHVAIDNGELDRAQGIVGMIRENPKLNAFELAYTYIVEGRIAEQRGDMAAQLHCFRKAMLNEGRWVGGAVYRKLLYAAVILEIQQEDFSSALRDYALLSSSKSGRELGEGLSAMVDTIRAMIENDPSVSPPFMVADLEITVKRDSRFQARPSTNNGWPQRTQFNSAAEREYQRMK